MSRLLSGAAANCPGICPSLTPPGHMRRDKSDRMGSRAVKIVPGAPCQPLLWTRPQKGLGDLRPPTSVPHSILSEILLAGGSWKESALFAGSVALMAAAVSKPFAQPATGIVKGNIAEEARQTPQAAAPLSLPPVVKLTTEDIWRQADLEDLDREGDGEGEEEWRRWEIPVRQPQSSLQALSASGRRQLLASSLEAVKRAVAAIPEEAERATLGEWRERVSNLLLEASADAATEWLGRPLPSLQRPVGNGENEKGTRHGGLKSAAIVPSDDKAERVAEREGAPGPLDLVAEKSLVHAVMLRDLRFKAVSCVDSPQHAVILAAAPAVVQDIVVTVADSVADALLEEVRQHPEPTEELTVRHMDWPDVLHPRITSTRSIERFCNQLLMWRWWEANFVSVKAMYEDRFHMWGFTASGRLVRRPLAARRGWEQGKLTGLRRNVSLALEMMDVSWPVVHALAMRIKDAVTWLLVSIIGQSLGLVAAGIRESMRRGSNEGAEQAAAQRGQHKAEEQRTPKGGGDPWGNGAFVF